MALLWDVLHRFPRSFREDAVACTKLLSPQSKLLGKEYIPNSGPCLLAANHYSRHGFAAWWIALGISAAVPAEIHWLMTAVWTHLGPLEPLTRWLFPHLARAYGFTIMPPMPPDPRETKARAQSVRQALRYARQTTAPVIGLAPEGRDHPGGILAEPPSGVGRFIGKLMPHCKRITPIGVYEDDEYLCVNFGPAFQLETLPNLSADQRDFTISRQVMRAIARQLPIQLRGGYGS